MVKTAMTPAEAGAEAGRRIDAGWACAESVVATLAERQGIHSDLIPAMATGFCGGVSRRGGMCGAVSGAVMAIGMANGRRSAAASREPNYAATQALVDGFVKAFGSTNCLDLLGLALDTEEGQAEFRARGLIAALPQLRLPRRRAGGGDRRPGGRPQPKAPRRIDGRRARQCGGDRRVSPRR